MEWTCVVNRNEHMVIHEWLREEGMYCFAPRWCLVAPVPSRNRWTLPLRLRKDGLVTNLRSPGVCVTDHAAENNFLFATYGANMTTAMTMHLNITIASNTNGKENPLVGSMWDCDPWLPIRLGEAAHHGSRELAPLSEPAILFLLVALLGPFVSTATPANPFCGRLATSG